QCWHAGNATYNRNAIGIEICVNSDGNYKKAVNNAADLVKSLMKKYGISAGNLIQHNTASGKDCPHFMRAGSKGVNWGDFKAKLGGKSTSNSKPSKPSKPAKKPSKSISKMADEVIAGKHGSGHANRRKSLGISQSQYAKVRKEVNNRTGGKSSSKPSKSKTKANLTVDGKAGKATVKAIQIATGSRFKDGSFSGQNHNSATDAFYSGISFGSGGSPSVKLFQKKIGTTADGHIGPNTVRALQRYLGTPVDGVISRPSSAVIKELQRKLNNGTF